MESSLIAHRSLEETIDANLLMTLLWRLLKHRQRGRRQHLQGEAARLLPTWTRQQYCGVEMLMPPFRPEGSASFRSNHNNGLSGRQWANLLDFINTITQTNTPPNTKLYKGCCGNYGGHHGAEIMTFW